MYITPRTLLGIIRIAQAMARIGFREFVCKEDIDEALRLMEKCRSSIIEEAPKEKELHKVDPISAVMNAIKDIFEKKQAKTLNYDYVKSAVVAKGMLPDMFEKAISQYVSNNVLDVNKETNELILAK